jgi:hypothetical protein
MRRALLAPTFVAQDISTRRSDMTTGEATTAVTSVEPQVETFDTIIIGGGQAGLAVG